jgi:tRNA uridine 5-carbamoylmethylation protein Kti12
MDKNKKLNFIKNIKKIEDIQKRKLEAMFKEGLFASTPHHPFYKRKP